MLSGGEIIVSHPRFYWGETGNVLTKPLFKIPIPASRSLVPTGYGYVLPDQNGWSRALHLESAWVLVGVGLLYVVGGILNGHLRRDLLPGKSDLSWRSTVGVIKYHLRIEKTQGGHESYNVLQRLAYLSVVFILFPLVIWTGLAMSPAFDAAFPETVNWLGGRQSARTIHFIVSIALVLFLFVHVAMIWREGFVSRMRAMITGRAATEKERA
jgi:thiosulfate reductase cytochrome b subunit